MAPLDVVRGLGGLPEWQAAKGARLVGHGLLLKNEKTETSFKQPNPFVNLKFLDIGEISTISKKKYGYPSV